MADPRTILNELNNALFKVGLDHMFSVSDLKITAVENTANGCTMVDFLVELYDNHPSTAEKQAIERDIKFALNDTMYYKASYSTFVRNLVIKYVPYRFR